MKYTEETLIPLALLIAPALARFGSDEPTQGFGKTKLSAAPGIPFL